MCSRDGLYLVDLLRSAIAFCAMDIIIVAILLFLSDLHIPGKFDVFEFSHACYSFENYFIRKIFASLIYLEFENVS